MASAASCSPKFGFHRPPILPMARTGWCASYNQRAREQAHQGRQNTPSAGRGLSCRSFATTSAAANCTPWPNTWATFLRCIALPRPWRNLSLTQLKLEADQDGARVVRHAAPSPSSLPRWRSQAPWSGPSSLRSTAFERLRHVRDPRS